MLNREIDISSVRAYVTPPTGIQQLVKLDPNGQGSYVPDKYGLHEIQLEVNDDKYENYNTNSIDLAITCPLFLFQIGRSSFQSVATAGER